MQRLLFSAASRRKHLRPCHLLCEEVERKSNLIYHETDTKLEELVLLYLAEMISLKSVLRKEGVLGPCLASYVAGFSSSYTFIENTIAFGFHIFFIAGSFILKPSLKECTCPGILKFHFNYVFTSSRCYFGSPSHLSFSC